MKKIIFGFLTLAMFFACKPSETEIKEINFSGKIENGSGDTLMIRQNGEIQKFAVDESGQFKGKVDGHGYFQLRYKREGGNLFFTNGQNLVMNTDYNNFDSTLVFTGESASPNNYLISKYKLSSSLEKDMGTKELYSKNEVAFAEELEKQEKAINQHLDEAELNDNFKNLESKNIKFEFLNNYNVYQNYHRYFTGNKEFEASNDFNRRFENLDYSNEADFLNVPKYNELVMDHFTDGELKESLDKLNPIESGAIKNEVITTLSNYYLSPSTENLKDIVDQMKSLATDPELVTTLNDSYQKMNALTKGNVSPGFDYKSVKGGNVNLEDLKGKNVYIDVWATWCGPCKQEIPHLKELEKSYHGDNIEFVSISVDEPKDEDKWVKMIADKELKGVQLLSDNGWDTDFVNDYLIKGIPRFILLDKEGKIVSADAPRPSSDKELTDMINAIL